MRSDGATKRRSDEGKKAYGGKTPSSLRRFVASSLLLAGCQTTGTPSDDARILQPPPYAELAERHNARLARIKQVYGRGNIELRWRDDSGDHFEQGDVDLWLARPDRLAMNVSKFSERVVWIGAAPGHAWVFDLRGDETVLHCTLDRDGWSLGTDGKLPVTPQGLLAMAGLEQLSAEPAAVEYDLAEDAWIVHTRRPGGSGRLFLDRATGLPVRTEELGPDGHLLAASTLKLSRYEPVSIDGLPGGPKFPTLIDIETTIGGSMRLALRGPTNNVSEKYFDLDWLVKVLAPDRREGDCGMLTRK